MPDAAIQKTRNKLAGFYGVGILVFTAMVAFITVSPFSLRAWT